MTRKRSVEEVSKEILEYFLKHSLNHLPSMMDVDSQFGVNLKGGIPITCNGNVVAWLCKP